MIVKVKNLIINDENGECYNINISYLDQSILQTDIKVTHEVDDCNNTTIIGTMCYDPSDYEKMSLFADYPLTG